MSRTLHFLILLPLILIPFLSNTCSVHIDVYNLVSMDSLRPASTCSSSSSPGIKVAHRYGPCSPLQDNSAPPTSHQLSLKDQARVDHKSTPGRFQCEPCSVKCYRQKEPIFDPSASSTYTSTSCNIYRRSCDHDYQLSYADKSYSSGHYAHDTLTLPGSGTIPHFTFGCGQNNSDGFNDFAGVFGLSKGGDHSILSQTKSAFGQIFCYCLTPSDGQTGYLVFGRDALSRCKTKTSTPLLAHPDNLVYFFVDLLGITIGTKRLAVSSFLTPNSKTPNTVMDSGTVITRLPSSVYSALRDEFKSLMSGYPKAPRHELLDTCYDLTGHVKAAIPKMALHFRGADVALNPSGVVVWEKDSQVCLGFAHKEKHDGFNIIGSTQQKTVAILHHIPQNKLGFRTNAC